MVTVLSALTSLEFLHLQFPSLQSRPDQATQHPPSPTRSSLPVLTELRFKGVSEYVEDLVARIVVPQLSTLDITFFNEIIFDTSQLVQFICRTPKLKLLKDARVLFDHDTARVTLASQTSGHRDFTVEISCEESDRQLSTLAQIFTSSLPPVSTLEDLYIQEEEDSQLDWQNNIEIMAWLELLRPFTGVKDLYLSKQFVPRIAPALQVLVGDRSTEVLPALQNIFLEGLQSSGPVQEGIVQFVAARQVTSHPITVACWERRKDESEEEEIEDEDDEDENDDDEDDEDEDDGDDDDDDDDEVEDD
jgi:hypothetical protein